MNLCNLLIVLQNPCVQDNNQYQVDYFNQSRMSNKVIYIFNS